MHIYLRAYGHLEHYLQQGEYAGDDQQWVKLKTDSLSIKSIIRSLGIPDQEVCFLVRNGEFMDWDEQVQEGDRIELIPPIEGG
ncbi:thiamineS protein [Caldalkalibacillus thermarum TA2.A1]|uniref:MoaD/ThiS family protein n=1 Tax=Caldalkalibacillus thermarum (strain TA2.A1) TaxID=986075 RepID=F5L5M5_CALTT|nr:MoaD/ThiS family protein [Caldalkalibacillus thermarum]EGL83342.1 thiamineS protein [Caldalkalibacillus thermarum TA2.A1]QZT34883.1 MoaD/ThiS family protein [Caldalkalibacillus thermarum TA2.A1]